MTEQQLAAMKQALEALCDFDYDKRQAAITSLRQAIEQVEKWVEVECPLCGEMAVAHTHPVLNHTTPQPKRKPLTDEQKLALCKQFPDHLTFNAIEAIEAKLKEKTHDH